MDTLTDQVRLRIKAIAHDKKRSNKSIAEGAGIPVTTFDRKLNRNGDFTLTEISGIADALGVNPWDLLPTSLIAGKAA